MSGQCEIKTFTYPNMVVRVHLPDLTDEEQKKRMKKLYKATEELLKETVRGRKKKA